MNSYNPIQNLKPSNASGEIDIMKLAKSIWQGKWLILSLVVFCLVLGDLYVRRIAISLYPATSMIAFHEDQPQIITDIESIMSGLPITNVGINTELEVLRSRDLAGQLVDRLDLMNRPDFNNQFNIPLIIIRAKAWLLTIFDKVPQIPLLMPSEREARASVISSVINAMEISNPHKTLLINISFTTNNAKLSVLMANAMAEIYIENQIQLKEDALAGAIKFLSSRTLELKNSFENSKIKLAEFIDHSEIINKDFLQAQELQLREQRTRLVEARERLAEETVIRMSFRLMRENGNIESLINTADDFRLNRAFSQYRNNLISVFDLNQEVDRFMLEIKDETKRDRNQLKTLEESNIFLENHIEKQSQELIIIQQFEREVETSRLLYESFFKRLQEMNVQLGLETADARLISKAIPMGSSSPIKGRILLSVGIIGAFVGAGLVSYRELRFAGFRSTVELHDSSGVGVLASVPLIPTRERKSVISYFKDKPNSVISEAVRNLRTSILMYDPNRVLQVIMLTSSVPGEGKSLLTFALAQNMVGLGKRVLLIEADIRRHIYSIKIDRKNSVPLVDLLMDEREYKDVNLYSEELGFDILTGSKSDMNAADLFASQRFSNLISKLREHYDYILIDTPPVLVVPDARVIAANSDVNIYIVKWNKTTRAQVNQGLDMFSSIGINTTGLVLNQIDTKKMKFHGNAEQYYYDAYRSGYYDGYL